MKRAYKTYAKFCKLWGLLAINQSIRFNIHPLPLISAFSSPHHQPFYIWWDESIVRERDRRRRMEWSRKTTFVKKGLKRPQGKALNSIRNALLTQRKGPYSFLTYTTVPLCACKIRIFLRIMFQTKVSNTYNCWLGFLRALNLAWFN